MEAERDRFGLIGENPGHSFSPRIFNAYFRLAGRDSFYELFSVRPEKLEFFMEDLRLTSVRGLNVTIPHKERMAPILDEISGCAERIGSVNVVRFSKGRLYGENTDYKGFMRAVTPLLNKKKKNTRAAVLGTGGAARAVIYGLSMLGVKNILFFGRKKEKRRKILQDFPFVPFLKGEAWTDEKIAGGLQKADLVVNATPVGMFPQTEESPLPPGFGAGPGTAAFDLVYNPFTTRFLKSFMRKGAPAENGWRMLVYQAVEALKLWNGEEVNEPLFFQAAEEVRNAAVCHGR